LAQKTGVPTLRYVMPAAFGLAAALAAAGAHAQGTSGENYSAGKTAAQLFTSDCTGSGCHSGPQGLVKGRSSGDLTGYLRAHYTNSRQSAALLAGYLLGVGGEARSARTEKPQRPEPPERVERTERAERDWLQIPFPNLFGRSEAESPPVQTEAAPPPRSRQSTRQPPTTEPPVGGDARPAWQESSQRPEQEGSLFAPLQGLFGREAAEKPPAQTEAAPPARTRQSRRQPPKTEETVRQPTGGGARSARPENPPRSEQEGSLFPPLQTLFGRDEAEKPPAQTQAAPPVRTRQSIRQTPRVEPAAKPPTETDAAPPARTRQSTRQPPKSEEPAKPTGGTDANLPPRTQRSARQPPKIEDSARPPVHTGAVPSRTRRSAPPLPVTEDNAGPPNANEIYRPARRGQSSLEPRSNDGVTPASEVVIPETAASAPARQPQIFD
jgi:hypothetical protein